MSRYIVFLFALISFELHGQAGVSPAKEVNIFGRSELTSAKEVDISTAPRPRAPANLERQSKTIFYLKPKKERHIIYLLLESQKIIYNS